MKIYNVSTYKNHKHLAYVNIIGNGETTIKEHHKHEIKYFKILPAHNHVHTIIKENK